MTNDEKGQQITSAVVEMETCQWCRTAINVHAKGRRPKFCGPRCRNRYHRAKQRLDRAYAELMAAGEALERGGAEPRPDPGSVIAGKQTPPHR